MNAGTRLAALLAGIALATGAGCGDDDGKGPDGGTTGDAGTDGGLDASTPTDGGVDAGLGGPGDACDTGDDCASGLCVNPAAVYDIGTGYCTEACSEDSDCTLDDGYDYRCIDVRGTQQCVRSCTDGFGCPETDACLDDWRLGATTADVCLDMSNDHCSGDMDCEETEHCRPVIGDREKIFVACFTNLSGGGIPLTDQLHTGEACDPRSNIYGPASVPCDVTADCPDGWRCLPRPTDDRRVCTPPSDETCGWVCGNAGTCLGVCEEDADCPDDMRCSRYQFPAISHGTPSLHDDEVWDVGRCEYATGSRTACTREAARRPAPAARGRSAVMGPT